MQEKGIFEYFKEAVTLKYKDFSGRARRREYWSYALCTFVIAFVVGLIDGLFSQRHILSLIVSLALLLPSLAISLRRLQDIGKPWQYILFAFIPIIWCSLPALSRCAGQPARRKRLRSQS